MTLFKPRSLRKAFGFSFIFTVLSKTVGYARQWLMAYCFGISRQVDIYLMAFGITMLAIFPFTVWFDQIILPRLVIAREDKSPAAFEKLCASTFSLSLVMAGGLILLFLAWVPLASWLLSHGFTPPERAGVRRFAWFFIPWVLVIFPYSALSSILKSLRYYDAVLTADFVVSLTGTIGFLLWHRDLIALPLSLALGYLLGALGLAVLASRFAPFWRSPWTQEMRPIFKDFGRMLFIYPISFFQQSVDRLFQSYLVPGAIAACGYASQIVAPTFELLAFDEAFIVPLSSLEGRAQKLHRLLAGLILLTLPLMLFLFWKAPAIIALMFQYGHFDVHARALTCAIFRVLIITLSNTLCTPLIRLLQIAGRVIQIGYIYSAGALTALLFNYFFVFKLGWRATGTTAALVVSMFVALIVAVFMVKHAGYPLQLIRLAKYLAWALTASAVAAFIAHHIPAYYLGAPGLIIEGMLFGGILALFYWPLRGQLRFILYG